MNTTQITQFIVNHWMLVMAFAVILALVIFEEARKSIRPAMGLSPQEAVQLMNHESTAVIDVRDHKAFKSGHIINAINIPQAELLKNQQRLAAYKDKPFIIVAALDDDARKIAQHLKQQGFNQARILISGIDAWKKAHLPLIS